MQGYPKPETKWFKRSGASDISLTNVNSEVLTMGVSSLENTGQYRCEAINALGTDMASFGELIYIWCSNSFLECVETKSKKNKTFLK